jgi:hypothetical protein
LIDIYILTPLGSQVLMSSRTRPVNSFEREKICWFILSIISSEKKFYKNIRNSGNGDPDLFFGCGTYGDNEVAVVFQKLQLLFR